MTLFYNACVQTPNQRHVCLMRAPIVWERPTYEENGFSIFKATSFYHMPIQSSWCCVHGWMCTNFWRNIDILVWMWLSFATFAYDCKRWITCYMLYELTDCWKLICVLPLTISLQLNNCIHCIYNYNGRLRWVYKTRNSKVLHGLTHKFIFKIYNIYSTKLINNITIIYNKKKIVDIMRYFQCIYIL